MNQLSFEQWVSYIKNMTQRTTSRPTLISFKGREWNVRIIVGSSDHKINNFIENHVDINSYYMNSNHSEVIRYYIEPNMILLTINRFELMERIFNSAKTEININDQLTTEQILFLNIHEFAEKLIVDVPEPKSNFEKWEQRDQLKNIIVEQIKITLNL